MNDPFVRLFDREVLVTGASGFIGGRLVELLLQYGARPRVLVRKRTGRTQLEKLGGKVKLVEGSINDAAALEVAVSRSAMVFHCAYDSANADANLAGIRELILACIKHTARLVHVSTFATYFPRWGGDLSENEIPARPMSAYARTKFDIEETILNALKISSLDAVILLPTVVYGPSGRVWTLGPATQILNGTVVLPDCGGGFCNAVYVDDVCQALMRAAVEPRTCGRRYLISADRPVTWKEFFEWYARALGRPGPKCLTLSELEQQVAASEIDENFVARTKRRSRLLLARGLTACARDNLNPLLRSGLKPVCAQLRRIAPLPVYLPGAEQIEFYSTKCRVVIDKARRDLGYTPEYDLAKGMQPTANWLRARLL